MKRKYLILLPLIIFITGCITATQKHKNVENTQPELIQIYDTSHYLSAKGRGMSESEAVMQAKAELSSIFSAQIASDLTSKSKLLDEASGESSFTKSIESSIRVISNTKLQGIQIEKIWKENGEYVALAVLDKYSFKETETNKINQIDTKISVLLEESDSAKSRFSKLKPLKKILNLWTEREAALSRLRVLGFSDSEFKQHDLKSILLNISTYKADMLIFIEISGEYAHDVKDIISEILTNDGFKVKKLDSDSKPDIIISGTVVTKEVHNDNQNFKFSRAIVSLNIIDSILDSQIGQISENIRATGLTHKEADRRAIKKLSYKLKEKILNFFK